MTAFPLFNGLALNTGAVPAWVAKVIKTTSDSIGSLIKTKLDDGCHHAVQYFPAGTSGCGVGVIAVATTGKQPDGDGKKPSPVVSAFLVSDGWVQPTGRRVQHGGNDYIEKVTLVSEITATMRSTIAEAMTTEFRVASIITHPATVVDVSILNTDNLDVNDADRIAGVITGAVTNLLLMTARKYVQYAPAVLSLRESNARFAYDVAFGHFDHIDKNGDMVRADARMNVYIQEGNDRSRRQLIGTVFCALEMLYLPKAMGVNDTRVEIFTPQVVVTSIQPAASPHAGWYWFLALFSVNLTRGNTWAGMLVYTPPAHVRAMHRFEAVATEIPLLPDERERFRAEGAFLRQPAEQFERRPDNLAADTRRFLDAFAPSCSLAFCQVPGTVGSTAMKALTEFGKLTSVTLKTLLGEENYNAIFGVEPSLLDNFRIQILPAGEFTLPTGQRVALSRATSYFGMASLLGATNPELVARHGVITSGAKAELLVAELLKLLSIAMPGDNLVKFTGVEMITTVRADVLAAAARVFDGCSELIGVTGSEILEQNTGRGRTADWTSAGPTTVNTGMRGSQGGMGGSASNPYAVN